MGAAAVAPLLLHVGVYYFNGMVFFFLITNKGDIYIILNKNNTCTLLCIQCSGGSRISPRKGRQLPGGGGANLRFCKFSLKLHENEEFLAARVGRTSPAAHPPPSIRHCSVQCPGMLAPPGKILDPPLHGWYGQCGSVSWPCYKRNCKLSCSQSHGFDIQLTFTSL